MSDRFVAKAEAGVGWRIWNRKTKRWWGNFFAQYPEQLLEELNGEKRPDRIVELSKGSYPPKD